MVDAGRAIFQSIGCTACHSGPAFTDSGKGNPTLDLTGDAGPIVLHDVGTCVTPDAGEDFFGFGNFPDVAHQDILGDARAGCLFDTPTLRGLSDSAPYLHAGNAQTLDDIFWLPDGGALVGPEMALTDGPALGTATDGVGGVFEVPSDPW